MFVVVFYEHSIITKQTHFKNPSKPKNQDTQNNFITHNKAYNIIQ
jgi:hypothetical protein